MIHLINGKVIPENQVECMSMYSLFTKLPQGTETGNCEKCAMKQFAPTKSENSKYYGFDTKEMVNIDHRCPWLLMMEERDAALYKNESLIETISDALNEINTLKDILEKYSAEFSL